MSPIIGAGAGAGVDSRGAFGRSLIQPEDLRDSGAYQLRGLGCLKVAPLPARVIMRNLIRRRRVARGFSLVRLPFRQIEPTQPWR